MQQASKNPTQKTWSNAKQIKKTQKNFPPRNSVARKERYKRWPLEGAIVLLQNSLAAGGSMLGKGGGGRSERGGGGETERSQ